MNGCTQQDKTIKIPVRTKCSTSRQATSVVLLRPCHRIMMLQPRPAQAKKHASTWTMSSKLMGLETKTRDKSSHLTSSLLKHRVHSSRPSSNPSAHSTQTSRRSISLTCGKVQRTRLLLQEGKHFTKLALLQTPRCFQTTQIRSSICTRNSIRSSDSYNRVKR